MSKDEIDIVDDFAYPFPVTVTCHLLGVPREDEPRFHGWVETIIMTDRLRPRDGPEEITAARAYRPARDSRQYLAELLEQRHGRPPGEDLLSRLANDEGPTGA